MCEICSKLTIKTAERRECCRSGIFIVNAVFIVNFEYISHLCSSVSVVSFELVIADCHKTFCYASSFFKGRYFASNQPNINMFKVHNKGTRAMSEICS